MTGTEYTERLIQDLEKILILQNQSTNPFIQVKKAAAIHPEKPKNLHTTMGLIDMPTKLMRLAQCSKNYGYCIDNKNLIKTPELLAGIKKNKTRISQIFQEIIDNDQDFDVQTNKKASKELKECLDDIHQITIT